MRTDGISGIWAPLRLAGLLIASAWIGMMVLVRIEWVPILCGGAFIVHAWTMTRGKWMSTPAEGTLWALGVMLALALAMAGVFDLLDLGDGSRHGDWDTGFLFGAALATPIVLARAWALVRGWWMDRSRESDPCGTSDDPDGARVAIPVSVAIGVSVFANEVIAVKTVATVVPVVVLAGCVSLACSVLYRRVTQCWGSAPQLIAELVACLCASCAILTSGVVLYLSMFFLAFAVLKAVDHIPSTTWSPRARPWWRLLDAFRHGAIGMLVAAGVLAGVSGSLGARYNLTVADVVLILDEAVPLSGAGFAYLVMTDEYLWADTVPRIPGWQISLGGEDPLVVVRMLRLHALDSWSDGMTTRVFEAFESGLQYGIGVEFAPDEADDVVAYVHPGSPADRAGVRRGWRLRRKALEGEGGSAERGAQVFEDTSGKRRQLDLRLEWRKVPMVSTSVLEADGRRVGYLLLWEFTEGAQEELDRRFAAFREQGIDELIIDLRYNPGGRLSTAKRLAELIAGEPAAGKVFMRVLHNSRYADSNRTLRLRDRSGSLAMKRVFVLTTSGTCSASEALINGLSPIIEVVTIGERTCGKPVGYQAKTFRGVTYGVISFRIENARGEGEYFHGLVPTCRVAESFRTEMGREGDPLVDAALGYIGTGRCPGRTGADLGESRDGKWRGSF